MKSIFWKLYTGVFFFFVAMALVESLFFTNNILWFEYTPRMIVLVFAVIGLVGFVWKKPFLKPFVWKVVFYSLLGVFLWVQLRRNYSVGFHQICSSLSCDIVSILIGVLFVFPIFYANFIYAFRSPSLWKK